MEKNIFVLLLLFSMSILSCGNGDDTKSDADSMVEGEDQDVNVADSDAVADHDSSTIDRESVDSDDSESSDEDSDGSSVVAADCDLPDNLWDGEYFEPSGVVHVTVFDGTGTKVCGVIEAQEGEDVIIDSSSAPYLGCAHAVIASRNGRYSAYHALDRSDNELYHVPLLAPVEKDGNYHGLVCGYPLDEAFFVQDRWPTLFHREDGCNITVRTDLLGHYTLPPGKYTGVESANNLSEIALFIPNEQYKYEDVLLEFKDIVDTGDSVLSAQSVDFGE